jgi:Family of unknown function (DUF5684)
MAAALLAVSTGAGVGIGVGAFVGLVVIVFEIAAVWRVFVKAGDRGWKAIIPIWNTLIVLKISGRPWWWIFLYIIPVVWWIVYIIVYYDLAKSFGKSTGFGIGVIILPFIFVPILGFGSSQYVEPYAAGPRAI